MGAAPVLARSTFFPASGINVAGAALNVARSTKFPPRPAPPRPPGRPAGRRGRYGLAADAASPSSLIPSCRAIVAPIRADSPGHSSTISSPTTSQPAT
jgi:hypothetical protein